MSITEALARIDQISTRVSAITGATPAGSSATGAAGDTTFSAALAAASGTAPATPSSSTTTPSVTTAQAPQPGTDTSGVLSDPSIPANLRPLIVSAAREAGVDPALVAAVARAESGFRVDAGSRAGARGLMQLMPGTAAGLGVTDILDPAQNLRAGSRYLKQQINTFGDLRQALAAYNAGPGAVRRYGGIPPYAETQAYVRTVTGYYDQYRGRTAAD